MVHHTTSIAVLAAVLAVAASGTATADDSADELSKQATDPSASLMSLQFIGDYVGGYHGTQPGLPDDTTVIAFRPVIPFKAFGQDHILRISLPYLVDGRGESGLGDVAILDVVPLARDWGRWLVGGVVSLAGSDEAPDDIAAGPVFGFIRPASSKLNLGLINQNLFAGDTGVSQLQPVVAYQLGGGWSLSGGDLQLIYDWEDSRWLSLPIGVQVGKVLRFGQQPVRLSLNPQYNFADDAGLPEWSVKLNFSLLVPAK